MKNKRGIRLAAPLALSLLCALSVFGGCEAKQSSSGPTWNDQQSVQQAGFQQPTQFGITTANVPQASGGLLTNRSGSSSSSGAFLASDYLAEISGDGLNHWLPERFPIRVFFEPGEGVPDYQPDFKKILTNSLDQWCHASEGCLSWREVGDKRQSDLVCRWIDQAPEREQGTEAGRTRLYITLDTGTKRGVIKRATMDLLTSPPDRKFTADEIKKAYLHECGHAFGLSGHSSEHTDIMAAVVTRSQPAQLSGRDITSIRRLYADYRYPQQTVQANRSKAKTVQSSSAVSRD